MLSMLCCLLIQTPPTVSHYAGTVAWERAGGYQFRAPDGTLAPVPDRPGGATRYYLDGREVRRHELPEPPFRVVLVYSEGKLLEVRALTRPPKE